MKLSFIPALVASAISKVDGDGRTGTSSNGQRLCIVHAITRHGPLAERDAAGVPVSTLTWKSVQGGRRLLRDLDRADQKCSAENISTIKISEQSATTLNGFPRQCGHGDTSSVPLRERTVSGDGVHNAQPLAIARCSCWDIVLK